MSRKVLGKGLGALIPGAEETTARPEAAETAASPCSRIARPFSSCSSVITKGRQSRVTLVLPPTAYFTPGVNSLPSRSRTQPRSAANGVRL